MAKKRMDLSNAISSEWDLALHEILKMVGGCPHQRNTNGQIMIGFGDGHVSGLGAPFVRYLVHC